MSPASCRAVSRCPPTLRAKRIAGERCMSVSHRNATRVFATLPTMTETSKLFATIGQLTEEDVRADLARIRQAREKLELEETLLLQVLDLVRSDKTSGAERSLRPDNLGRLAAARHAASGRPTAGSTPNAPLRAGRGQRLAITRMMRVDPARTWTSAEMHEALAKRGSDVTAGNVRMTLQRMERAGEISRVARGKYKLPSERSPASVEGHKTSGPGTASAERTRLPDEWASRDARSTEGVSQT